MIDSHMPRFAQALQAVLLVAAFVLQVQAIVPIVAAVLLAAALGGPGANLFAHLYRALPLPRGEPEPAAPPRFAQRLGAALLVLSSLVLYLGAARTAPWWVLGWGPGLVVAALSALAATTGFCLGCEMYLLIARRRTRRAA